MEETTKLPPEDYTVGWICAIEPELKVARAMLDKIHAAITEQDRHDDNIYTLGSVGQHNVVIACLPECGIATAATAAKDLMRTFRNIRFGLMVGIGGGIPSAKHDIRLGDVVVSMPNETGGGVVQYDIGRKEKDGFHRKGTLNKPPKLLRTAAININTSATLSKDIAGLIRQAWEQIGTDLEDDENEWVYPGADMDILFKATFDHIDGNSTCAECAEQGLVLQRHPRKNTYPKIHRGNIASGNTVMKNAVERDILAKAENVICFEMEAAGLMDSFPCLVIRGISDYADSHKNWEWQPYAAAVAAAYAKLLLSVVPPPSVRELEPILKNKHWVVPNTKKVSPFFTGRTKILSSLYGALCPTATKSRDNGGTFVIQGMGGAGKSQICVKFAHDNRERFWGIFWVDGTTEETIKRSFVDIGSSWKNQTATPETVMGWLENEPQHWLLILDNCDDINIDYGPYFLSGHRGSIVMTTRNPKCIRLAKNDNGRHEIINSIEMEDAVTLLLRACEEDEKSWPKLTSTAQKIAGQLHCHPLALTQAGAYISKKLCSIDKYLLLFESERKELCKNHIEQGKSEYGGVYATFEVSAAAMSKSSDRECRYALELLNILAYLYREEVTEDMFLRVWYGSSMVYVQEDDADNLKSFSTWHIHQLPRFLIERQLELKQQQNGDASDFQLSYLREAMNTLQSFSLVNISETRGMSMHPLAHAWAKDRLQNHYQNQAWVSASTIIAMSIDSFEMRDYVRNIIMHIQFCFGSRPADLFSVYPGFQICIILYHFWWLQYNSLDIPGMETTLAILRGRINVESKIKKPSMNFSRIQSISALQSVRSGMYEQAKEMLEDVIEFYQVSRPNKADLKRARERLATIYESLGSIEVAKGLLKRYARIPPSDPYTQYQLAVHYCNTEQYHKARNLLKKALKISEDNPEYLQIPTILEELAGIYGKSGDPRKALLVQKDVIHQMRRVYHDKHISLYISISNLAMIYDQLGEIEKSMRILKFVVWSLQKFRQGEYIYNYLDIASHSNQLAQMYSSLHQLEEATKILRALVRKLSRRVEPTHPDLLRYQNELSLLYLKQGQTHKAIPILKNIVSICGKTMKEIDYERLTYERNLAKAYGDLGKYRQAITIAKHVVRVRRKVSQPGDEDLLDAEALISTLIAERAEDTERAIQKQLLPTIDLDSQSQTVTNCHEIGGLERGGEDEVDAQTCEDMHDPTIEMPIAAELVPATDESHSLAPISEAMDDANRVETSTRVLSATSNSEPWASLEMDLHDDVSESGSYVISENEPYEISDAESYAISAVESCDISEGGSYTISEESSLELSDDDDNSEVREIFARWPVLDPANDDKEENTTCCSCSVM
ncbi:violaceus kinesin protein [Rutstroemia sp. NJR-2017a WRK4]|nr:violaceus kinesin protein [Rutstroemia sp. NJR-2017a WRK4]